MIPISLCNCQELDHVLFTRFFIANQLDSPLRLVLRILLKEQEEMFLLLITLRKTPGELSRSGSHALGKQGELDSQRFNYFLRLPFLYPSKIKLNIDYFDRYIYYFFILKMIAKIWRKESEGTKQHSENELEVIKSMDQFTQNFLIKRKNIVKFLNILIIMNVVINIVKVFIIMNRDNRNKFIEIGRWISILLIEYYYVKKWHDSWHDYKNSIRYSKELLFLYMLYPIFAWFDIISNIALQIIIGIISGIHTFVLKHNNYDLAEEISKTYEYNIISRVLQLVHISITMFIIGYLTNDSRNLLYIMFGICYMLLIMIPFVSVNPIHEYLEQILVIICSILLIIIRFEFNFEIIEEAMNGIITYIMISVITVDITNDWIMENRSKTHDLDGGIETIARDVGYANYELMKLRNEYDLICRDEQYVIYEP